MSDFDKEETNQEKKKPKPKSVWWLIWGIILMASGIVFWPLIFVGLGFIIYYCVRN